MSIPHSSSRQLAAAPHNECAICCSDSDLRMDMTPSGSTRGILCGKCIALMNSSYRVPRYLRVLLRVLQGKKSRVVGRCLCGMPSGVTPCLLCQRGIRLVQRSPSVVKAALKYIRDTDHQAGQPVLDTGPDRVTEGTWEENFFDLNRRLRARHR